MFRTKLRFISVPILIFFTTHSSFATSVISTAVHAKQTFDLSQALIADPQRIATLKTEIESIHIGAKDFSGLNNKLIEDTPKNPWLLKNTLIKSEPINDDPYGGYSITTYNANDKACKAAKSYYSKGGLAVNKVLIDDVKDGPCNKKAKHKITIIFG